MVNMKEWIKKYFTHDRVFNRETLIAVILVICLIIAPHQIVDLIRWVFNEPAKHLILTITNNDNFKELVISIVIAIIARLIHKK